MPVFDQGGGGGRSPLFPANDNYALDKPYDLTGDPDADKMQQIDEMLRYLYQAATRNRERVTIIEGTPASGGGGVVVIGSGNFPVGGLIPDGTQTVILHRRLLAADLLAIAGTQFSMGIAPSGQSIIPFMVTAAMSITSPAAYLTSQTLGFRYPTGTADILSIGIGGTVIQERVFISGIASSPGVNAGSFTQARGASVVAQLGFTNVYLGVAGTDAPNYCDISVYCIVVTP